MPSENPEFGEPEFLGWTLLQQLKEQSDDQISRSKFLKLCCITDRRLQTEHDFDVGLPRYWYMYGELANQHEFSARFYNAPRAIGWEGQQYLPKELPVDAFDVSADDAELISRVVSTVVREFGRENVETIKRHQYEEHAETQFIREYCELRWLLNTIDLGSQVRLPNYTDGESNEAYVRGKLDAMIESYPREEERYDDVEALYLRWDDTVRLMLDQSLEYSRVAEFLDDFITALSKAVLRFTYNQHISAERLDDWELDAAEEKSAFASRLRETRRELLDDRPRSGELDGVSEAYSQTVEEQIERLIGRE